MAKSIKKNYIFNLAYNFITLFAPLIVTPYISRVLGVDNIGQYSYASSIVSYFTLVAVLGTSMFGQRNIGYVQNDPELRSRTFFEVLILRATMTAITLAGYTVFFMCLAPVSERVVFLIFGLNIINVAIDITWFMQGMEEFTKTATRSALFKVASIVCTFLLVKSEADLWIYVLINTGSGILGSLCMLPFLHKNVVRVRGIKPFRDIKSILQLFIPTITTQVYTVLDKSMIGWFSDGYAENGYYEQSEKIIKIALVVVTALGAVMIPRISRLYKEGNREKIIEYLYRSYRYVWLTAIPIMLGIIAVSDTFVPVFFGAGYDKCKLLMPIFSVLAIFIGLSNVTGIQYFVPTGKQNVLTMTIAVGAIVNVAINLILIPFFGSLGACIASVIAEFCVAVAGFIYIVKKREFSIKPIFTCSWKYWIAGAVMFASVALENYFFAAGAWQLAVMIATGVAVYAIMLLILRDSFVFMLLKSVTGIFRRKSTQPEAPEDNSNTKASVSESAEGAECAESAESVEVEERAEGAESAERAEGEDGSR